MSTLDNLPGDMVGEILKKVASMSVIDFLDFRSTCRFIREVAIDSAIYKSMNLGAVDIYSWTCYPSDSAKDFVDRLRQSGHPEVLVWDAIMLLEDGLTSSYNSIVATLRQGVDNHESYCEYLYALIVLVHGDHDLRQWAIDILVQLQMKGCFTDCRFTVDSYFKISHILRLQMDPAVQEVCKSKSTCSGCKYTLEDLMFSVTTDELDRYPHRNCPLCRIDLEIKWLLTKI